MEIYWGEVINCRRGLLQVGSLQELDEGWRRVPLRLLAGGQAIGRTTKTTACCLPSHFFFGVPDFRTAPFISQLQSGNLSIGDAWRFKHKSLAHKQTSFQQSRRKNGRMRAVGEAQVLGMHGLHICHMSKISDPEQTIMQHIRLFKSEAPFLESRFVLICLCFCDSSNRGVSMGV